MLFDVVLNQVVYYGGAWRLLVFFFLIIALFVVFCIFVGWLNILLLFLNFLCLLTGPSNALTIFLFYEIFEL